MRYDSRCNPQTYSKITQSLDKALAGRATVKYANMQSAPEFLAAITGASIDTCSIGSSPFVTGVAQQLDISMVYIHKVITNSEALVVRSDRSIATLADLKGKKIGLPFNTSAHFAMLGVLRKAGLSTSDVQLINLKPDALMATWASGSLDGAYIWHPFLRQMADDHGKILISTADLQLHKA
ncbi:ABC transporter substrate-binding protein [Pseudomonas syringae]|uniref:ABC transporter substrate-binding protein n=1 Tax=Pseudomonas syringae TaxID=317 RepID=UPI0009B3ADB7|nr:ABC transporter substrate-binding protein [Pseudomonas syringae]QGG77346.1 PhnD/SsuA/transferrin family substrate-binding protein [Pseudomonas syringae USA011]